MIYRNLRTFWNKINTTKNVSIELLHAFRKDEKNGRLSENYKKQPWAFSAQKADTDSS